MIGKLASSQMEANGCLELHEYVNTGQLQESIYTELTNYNITDNETPISSPTNIQSGHDEESKTTSTGSYIKISRNCFLGIFLCFLIGAALSGLIAHLVTKAGGSLFIIFY